MTPEQISALAGVHFGDLVLVITPEGLTSPPHQQARLLIIDSIRFVGMMTRRTIYARGPGSLQPEDWITFRRGPSSFWRNYQQGRPITDIDTLLSDEDVVLLRPAFDDMFHTIFNGICPFLYCHDGLVTVSSDTRVVLQDTAEAARRYGFNMRTLCPFCMGTALYRDHEVLVDGIDDDNPPRHDLAIRDEHIGRINARRAELSYPLEVQDTSLNNLRLEGDGLDALGVAPSDLTLLDILDAYPGADIAITSNVVTAESVQRGEALRDMISEYRSTVTASAGESDEGVEALRRMIQEAAPGALTSSTSLPTAAGPSNRIRNRLNLPPVPITAPVQRPGPVLPNLRTREWYVKAAERVLGSSCQICLERFMPGQVVADLPCWHFFHVECWSNVEGGKCPFRCNAETLSQVVEDVVD